MVNYIAKKDEANKVVRGIRRLGRKAITIQADLSSEEAVNQMVKLSIKEFRKSDVLKALLSGRAPIDED